MHFKTEELIDTDSLLMYPFGPLETIAAVKFCINYKGLHLLLV